MEWLDILEDFFAAVEQETLEIKFQMRLAGARIR